MEKQLSFAQAKYAGKKKKTKRENGMVELRIGQKWPPPSDETGVPPVRYSTDGSFFDTLNRMINERRDEAGVSLEKRFASVAR